MNNEHDFCTYPLPQPRIASRSCHLLLLGATSVPLAGRSGPTLREERRKEDRLARIPEGRREKLFTHQSIHLTSQILKRYLEMIPSFNWRNQI